MQTKNKPQKKLHQYRLVFHNTNPSDKGIEKMLANELGENIEVVNWNVERKINYNAAVLNSIYLLPQRDTLVIVKYKEKNNGKGGFF